MYDVGGEGVYFFYITMHARGPLDPQFSQWKIILNKQDKRQSRQARMNKQAERLTGGKQKRQTYMQIK